MAESDFRPKLLYIGIALGAVYGFFARLILGDWATLESITFLFIVPAVLGVISLSFADEEEMKSYKKIIFVPWITIFTFFVLMFVARVEDFLCLIILAAPFFVLSTIAAFVYRLASLREGRKNDKGKLMLLMMIPFILAPIESLFKSPSELIEVKSEILIEAPAAEIWSNIVEVKEIQPHEYEAGIFNSMGIPRPISASVDRMEVGGKRIGNFEGGLRFVETITRYEHNKLISFDIVVDPKSVRSKVFDQHVLKGNYFTFEDATYTLTDAGNGKVKLTLTSGYRLTSKVNFYGKFWGNLILKDFQDRLLAVVRGRCEG